MPAGWEFGFLAWRKEHRVFVGGGGGRVGVYIRIFIVSVDFFFS